jgi:hypothetical protein
MKKVISIGLCILVMISCHFNKNIIPKEKKNAALLKTDTLRIANDSLEYEIIIIEPGFDGWLASQAKPRGFYSESFLENKNYIYSIEWNTRVMQPQRYNSKLYEMQIDYNSSIHYGYEVNYLLYNYFIYFQITYKQALAGFVPRP